MWQSRVSQSVACIPIVEMVHGCKFGSLIPMIVHQYVRKYTSPFQFKRFRIFCSFVVLKNYWAHRFLTAAQHSVFHLTLHPVVAFFVATINSFRAIEKTPKFGSSPEEAVPVHAECTYPRDLVFPIQQTFIGTVPVRDSRYSICLLYRGTFLKFLEIFIFLSLKGRTGVHVRLGSNDDRCSPAILLAQLCIPRFSLIKP